MRTNTNTTKALSVIAAIVVSFVPHDKAAAETGVVPNALAEVEGNEASEFLTGDGRAASVRYQQVYAASQFAGVDLISEIAFRPDAVRGSEFSGTLSNVRIALSTTTKEPDGLSETFADNIGTDETVVFSGDLTIASANSPATGGAREFDIVISLSTPFPYDPSMGNLLFDFQRDSSPFHPVGVSFDAQVQESDSISRAFGARSSPSANFGVDSAGLVTRFSMLADPNSEPIADAGPDQSLECESPEGTLVLLDGTASSDPDGDDLEYEWSAAEGSGVMFDDPTSAKPMGLFPVGPTLVTLTVTDGNGGIDVDDVLITVVDTMPPVVVCTTDEVALWPPSHEMVPVEVTVVASDECEHPEELILDCAVSSSEPDDATGDGEFDGDVDGLDGFTDAVPLELAYDPLTDSFGGTILLRAERDGADSGRVYSIVCDVLDSAGNVATSSCVVVVPHDRRKN